MEVKTNLENIANETIRQAAAQGLYLHENIDSEGFSLLHFGLYSCPEEITVRQEGDKYTIKHSLPQSLAKTRHSLVGKGIVHPQGIYRFIFLNGKVPSETLPLFHSPDLVTYNVRDVRAILSDFVKVFAEERNAGYFTESVD